MAHGVDEMIRPLSVLWTSLPQRQQRRVAIRRVQAALL